MGFLRRKNKNKQEAESSSPKKFGFGRNKQQQPATTTTTTPAKSSPANPSTPPTEPIREKSLLDDLNVLLTKYEDGMEMVLGVVPKEETNAAAAAQEDGAPGPLLISGTYINDKKPAVVEEDKDGLDKPGKEEKQAKEDGKDGVDKPNKEEKQAKEGGKDGVDNEPATKEVTVPDSPLDANETDPLVDTIAEEEARCDGPEDVSRKLLKVFQCADLGEQVSALLPPSVQKIIPPSCQPDASDLVPKRAVERNPEYYNEQFAVKFLDEILNVGFALIYHQSSNEGEDWVGRSVTLVLKPGVCNLQEVVQPAFEFTSMGGGTQTGVETISVGLLDIHSIAASPNAEEMRDDMEDNEDADDELQCFFTITTNEGEVHVLEGITPEQSRRQLTGIKNLSARLSRQLIGGDAHALADFYDNHGESDEIRLSPEEAMVRLSHSFLD